MIETYNEFSSSNIAELQYEPADRAVFVQFKNSKTGALTAKWRYWPVERSDFESIRTASSVGKSVQENLVRSGLYNSEKVE